MEQSFLVSFQEVKVALRTEVDLNSFFGNKILWGFCNKKDHKFAHNVDFQVLWKIDDQGFSDLLGGIIIAYIKAYNWYKRLLFLGENIFWAKSVYNKVFWILKNLYVELDFSYLILFYFYFYFVFAPLWSLPWRGGVACMFQWTWRLCWLELCLLVGPPMSDRRRCRNQTKSVHWLWHAGIQ